MMKTFTLGHRSDHSREHFDFEVDVVDVDSYWVVLACITIFSVNFPIVSLRALCRLIQSTTGPITTKIYPDMANFIIDCPSAVK